MRSAYLSGTAPLCARRNPALLVLFAAALCQCSGSSRNTASGGSGSGTTTTGDDTSDDGGLIFARGPSSSPSDDTSEASSASPEASLEGSSGEEADTFTCDPTETPKDAACIINDAYGVFVAPPSGVGVAGGVDGGANEGVEGGIGGSDDAGNGTMAQPFATISKALQNLNGKSRVFICTGVYPEEVAIDASHAASLYGGLTCAVGPSGLTWHYTGAAAEARPTTEGRTALTISGVSSPLAIEDMGFEAPAAQDQDASGAGLSSIAAWVSNSTVSFSRVVLTAGDAGNGANGTTLLNYDVNVPIAPAPVNSTDPISQVCPPGAMSPPADSTRGGEGSIGSPMGSAGSAYPPPIAVTAPYDGLGGVSNYGDYAFPGDDGAGGYARSGGIAPTSLGSLSTTAWLPSPGGDGAAGTPGQGGGGGGSLPVTGSTTVFYFGGAGGTGGCGGGGGTGGKGGGASVALFSVGGTVTLTTCQLVSNQAGDGGNGGIGGPGQAGSAGHVVLYSGNGGAGGNGAGGSGGAGGTGGLSAGIVYQGSLPVSDVTTTISLGHGIGAGTAGFGGNSGNGAGSGADGVADGKPGANGLAGAYFTVHDADSP